MYKGLTLRSVVVPHHPSIAVVHIYLQLHTHLAAGMTHNNRVALLLPCEGVFLPTNQVIRTSYIH